MILVTVKLFSQIRVAALLNLTVDVVPFLTFFTLDPLLSICDFRVTIEVNLFAVVTVLVFIEGVGAKLAEPDEGLLV